ncbi:MAG: DEAD/DEAH box helicase [Myxococcota bacterium]|nr:DEAD/DEAH box helicase [Myxococcota bacterium]
MTDTTEPNQEPTSSEEETDTNPAPENEEVVVEGQAEPDAGDADPVAMSPAEDEASAEALDHDDETASVDDDGTESEGTRTDYRSGRRFDEFPISDEIIEGLHSLGYEEATQVQASTIEPGIAGRDLLVRAKTGTGKTCAFCVPLIERLEEGGGYPQGIILSPTRELATQIAEECAGIARYKNLRILAVYGGVAMGPQEDAFREGVDIVVGTPGRVLDHIRRGNLDLSKTKVSCLDEADEMLSMGFYEDVNNILKAAGKQAQVLLFSATVEERVKRLVQAHLNDPVDIMLSTDSDKVEGIEHILYETTPDFHRVRALLAIIDQEEPGSTIIFCNTREDTSTVTSFLSRQGLDAQLLSGELPQKKRNQVMNQVKSGAIQFLVATDVAARGIDISDITHVVNYSLPADPPVYMHRIGRTGRIGKKGKAISLVGGPDLATRNVLENQFDIQFNEKPLPTKEEAAELRVKRQAARLEAAVGTTAFEAYLPLVDSLNAREDGKRLLATALRIFFQWDRDERAKGSVDTLSALSEARNEQRGGRSRGGRGDGRRDGGRGEGRRDGGGGRRGRGGSGGRNRNRQGDSGSGQGKPDQQKAATAAPQDGGSTEASSGGGEKKRRRRRRRRRPSNGGGDAS